MITTTRFFRNLLLIIFLQFISTVSFAASNVMLYPTGTPVLVPTSANISNCADSGGNHLNYNSSTKVWTCGTTSSGGASIGGAVTSGTDGSVLFVHPAGTLAQDNPNLYQNYANHTLGIGTNSPSSAAAATVSRDHTPTINVNITPNASEIAGSSFYFAGDDITYSIFPYKTVNGTKIFPVTGASGPNVSILNDGDVVNLNWGSPSGGADGYYVVRSFFPFSGGSSYDYVDVGSALSATDDGGDIFAWAPLPGGVNPLPTSYVATDYLNYDNGSSIYSLYAASKLYIGGSSKFVGNIGVGVDPSDTSTFKSDITSNNNWVSGTFSGVENYGIKRRGDYGTFYSIGSRNTDLRLLEFVGYDRNGVNAIDGAYFNADYVAGTYEWHFDIVENGAGTRCLLSNKNGTTVAGTLSASNLSGTNTGNQTTFSGFSDTSANLFSALTTKTGSAGSAVFSIAPTFTTSITMSSANIITDTTTGTKIGTATTQKLGFFNATPVTQPAASAEIGALLANVGLRTSGNAYPITTSGTVNLSGSNTINGYATTAKAAQTLTYQPGLLTAVNATIGVYGKVSNASTVDNLIGSAVTFSCVANPTITMYECGTSATCASSPVTIGTVTVTAAGQAFVGTVSNSAITAGDYIGWAMTAGTCASIDISANAQIHSN